MLAVAVVVVAAVVATAASDASETFVDRRRRLANRVSYL